MAERKLCCGTTTSKANWVRGELHCHALAPNRFPGLALVSNRVTPISPTRQDLDEAYAGYLDVSQRPAIDAVDNDGLAAIVEECGLSLERRRVIQQLHYTTDDWVNMVLTYCNVLTLEPKVAHVPLHFLRRPQRIAQNSSDSRAGSVSIDLPGRGHRLAS